MTHDDPHDVVRVVATDNVVAIELYQQALAEEGIQSKVVGLSLEASFGTAIPNSIELWVNRADAGKAEAVIRELEADRESGALRVEEEPPAAAE